MIVAEGWLYVKGLETNAQLQWGRNLIVAEGCAGTGWVARRSRLQWGRNLIVAEGKPWVKFLQPN